MESGRWFNRAEIGHGRRSRLAGAESRVAPRTSILNQNPLVEVRIAFVTGPDGEAIEFLQSAQL